MNKPAELSKLSRELEQLALRLGGPYNASTVWDKFLTAEERDRLGELEDVYRQGGAVAIWARAKHISYELAIVQLSRKLGMPEGEYEYFLEKLGERPEQASPLANRLSWNRDLGELSYSGTVIRRVTKLHQATNILTILDTFEEEGWPPRIDDPLTGGPNPERLNQAVRTLNKGISTIKFRCDGSGEGVRYNFIN